MKCQSPELAWPDEEQEGSHTTAHTGAAEPATASKEADFFFFLAGTAKGPLYSQLSTPNEESVQYDTQNTEQKVPPEIKIYMYSCMCVSTFGGGFKMSAQSAIYRVSSSFVIY